MTLLSVRDLSLSYPLPRRSWRRSAPVRALHGLSFEMGEGERVGLVGMSGSGKSSLLRCLLAMEPAATGQVLLRGRPVAAGSVAALRWYRRAVQYVPQDPIASLEPRMTVAQSVAEPLLRLRVDCDPMRRAEEALESVGLDHRFLRRRPDELSGGQAQRVAIARAIATRPSLLLTDEPVSGLDMTSRVQVVEVLRHLSEVHGTAILMVSHDISVVAGLCRRAMVMDGGRIVEDRPVAAMLRDPHHPHTSELLNAAPPMTAAA
ncbi:ABC transporter ATP-binding protein [Cereibacter sp. SYSU M97828]|nr:ABC transporter ATP-binding protein [Cereibacter flavus]